MKLFLTLCKGIVQFNLPAQYNVISLIATDILFFAHLLPQLRSETKGSFKVLSTIINLLFFACFIYAIWFSRMFSEFSPQFCVIFCNPLCAY